MKQLKIIVALLLCGSVLYGADMKNSVTLTLNGETVLPAPLMTLSMTSRDLGSGVVNGWMPNYYYAMTFTFRTPISNVAPYAIQLSARAIGGSWCGIPKILSRYYGSTRFDDYIMTDGTTKIISHSFYSSSGGNTYNLSFYVFPPTEAGTITGQLSFTAMYQE